MATWDELLSGLQQKTQPTQAPTWDSVLSGLQAKIKPPEPEQPFESPYLERFQEEQATPEAQGRRRAIELDLVSQAEAKRRVEKRAPDPQPKSGGLMNWLFPPLPAANIVQPPVEGGSQGNPAGQAEFDAVAEAERVAAEEERMRPLRAKMNEARQKVGGVRDPGVASLQSFIDTARHVPGVKGNLDLVFNTLAAAASKRIEAGEGTDEDFTLLAEIERMAGENSKRDSFGQGLYDLALGAAPFMAGMGLSAPIRSGAKAAVKKQLGSTLAAEAAGVAAGVASPTMLPMSARAAAEYAAPTISDEGDVIAGDPTGLALAKGASRTATEVASEGLGELAAPAIAKFVPGWAKSIAAKVRGPEGSLRQAFSDTLQAAGIQNAPIESLEERATELMQGSTGLADDYGMLSRVAEGNVEAAATQALQELLLFGALQAPGAAGAVADSFLNRKSQGARDGVGDGASVGGSDGGVASVEEGQERLSDNEVVEGAGGLEPNVLLPSVEGAGVRPGRGGVAEQVPGVETGVGVDGGGLRVEGQIEETVAPKPLGPPLEALDWNDLTARAINSIRKRFPGLNVQDAEDLAQETMLRVSQTYDPTKGTPQALVGTILGRLNIDANRKARRTGEAVGIPEGVEPVDESVPEVIGIEQLDVLSDKDLRQYARENFPEVSTAKGRKAILRQISDILSGNTETSDELRVAGDVGTPVADADAGTEQVSDVGQVAGVAERGGPEGERSLPELGSGDVPSGLVGEPVAGVVGADGGQIAGGDRNRVGMEAGGSLPSFGVESVGTLGDDVGAVPTDHNVPPQAKETPDSEPGAAPVEEIASLRLKSPSYVADVWKHETGGDAIASSKSEMLEEISNARQDVVPGDAGAAVETDTRQASLSEVGQPLQRGQAEIPAFEKEEVDVADESNPDAVTPPPNDNTVDVTTTETALPDRISQIKAELDSLQEQYEKKSAKQSRGRGSMVPPAIKADALRQITNKMDKLDAELLELESGRPAPEQAAIKEAYESGNITTSETLDALKAIKDAGPDVVVGAKSRANADVERVLKREQEKGNPAWFDGSHFYLKAGKHEFKKDPKGGQRLVKLHDLSEYGMFNHFGGTSEYVSHNRAAIERKAELDAVAEEKRQAVAESIRKDKEESETRYAEIAKLDAQLKSFLDGEKPKGKKQALPIKLGYGKTTESVDATVYGNLAIHKRQEGKRSTWAVAIVPAEGNISTFDTKTQAMNAVKMWNKMSDWNFKTADDVPSDLLKKAKHVAQYAGNKGLEPEAMKSLLSGLGVVADESVNASKETANVPETDFGNKTEKAKPGTTRPDKPVKPALPAKSIAMMEDAIKAKDAPKLKEMLHLSNGQWRRQFEGATGVKLPKTVKGTEATVASWTAASQSGEATRQEDYPGSTPGPQASEPIRIADKLATTLVDQFAKHGYTLDPVGFRDKYSDLEPAEQMEVQKRLGVVGLLNQVDARKKKPIGASKLLEAVQGHIKRNEIKQLPDTVSETPSKPRSSSKGSGEVEAGKTTPDANVAKKKPDLKTRAKAARQEVKDAAKDLADFIKDMQFSNPMFNPELIAKVANLAAKSVKAGTLTFAEFVAEVAAAVGKDKANKLRPVLASEWNKLAEGDDSIDKAPPEEVTSGGVPDATSIKNAVVDELRAQRGLPEMDGAPPQSQEEWMEVASQAMLENPLWTSELLSELTLSPRNLSPVEIAALQQHYRALNNRFASAAQDLSDAVSGGDPAAIVKAQTEADLILSHLQYAEEATKAAGREWGRSGVARQIMLASDFSLVGMMNRAKVANGGKPLSSEDTAKIKELADKVAELQDKLDKHIQEQEDRDRERRVQQEIDNIRKVRKPTARKAAAAKRVDDAWANLMSKAKGKLFSTPVDIEVAAAGVELVRAYVDMGVVTFTEFMANVRQKVGDKAEKLEASFRDSWEQVKAQGGIPVLELDPLDLNAISRMAKQLQRALVEAGVTERDAVVDAVHAELQEIVPDLTRRQAMDAMSGYGNFRPLSKNEIDVIIRDINGQLQQLGKLDDMEHGEAPKKTGQERRDPTDEERRLIKKVNEAKKRGGYNVTDPESQLKGALQAAKTAVANQIADMTQEIETREKIVKNKTSLKADAELEQLRKQRDELRELHAKIFPKEGLTDEQKIAAAGRALDRAIAQMEADIESGDIGPKPKKAPVTSPELEAKRARLAALRAQRAELREAANPNARYKASLTKRLADWKQRIAEEDFAPRKRPQPKLDKDALAIKYEIEQEKMKFDKLAEAYRRKRMKFGAKVLDNMIEVLRTTRNIMTGGEFSAVFRQGGFVTAGHPVMAAKALPSMFHAFSHKRGEFESAEEIRSRENYLLYKQAGLAITVVEGKLSKQEEATMSRWTKYIPGIAGSVRAYVTFINRIRADYFDALVQARFGDGGITLEQAKVLATLVNVATGRGVLGPRGDMGAVAAASVFFAPKFVVSRFQLAVGQPLWKGDLKTKRIVAQEYARAIIGTAIITSLLLLMRELFKDDDDEDKGYELDARSSDFGKIRIGNTRIDPLFGLSQTIVFTTRVATGERKSSSGEIIDMRGEDKSYFHSVAGTMGSFLRSKLAPAIGAGVNLFDGEDIVGEPVTAQSELLKFVEPMTYRDIREAVVEQGVPVTTATAMVAMFGMGAGTYGDHNHNTALREIREYEGVVDDVKANIDNKDSQEYKDALEQAGRQKWDYLVNEAAVKMKQKIKQATDDKKPDEEIEKLEQELIDFRMLAREHSLMAKAAGELPNALKDVAREYMDEAQDRRTERAGGGTLGQPRMPSKELYRGRPEDYEDARVRYEERKLSYKAEKAIDAAFFRARKESREKSSD